MVFQHIPDLQVLYTDQLVFLDQSSGDFVQIVLSDICYLFVYPGNDASLLIAIIAAFDLAGKLSLLPCQFFTILLQGFRISSNITIRIGVEIFNSHIFPTACPPNPPCPPGLPAAVSSDT